MFGCNQNSLLLNVSKQKVLTFSKIQTTYLYNYKLNVSKLTCVYKNKTTGKIFDAFLLFNEHGISIQNKAFSMLGFINQSYTSFSKPYTLKALYSLYVYSILEYNFIIWSPSRVSLIQIAELI
jgi:hypothetical protein